MTYIDVHCHLDRTTYGDIAELASRCIQNGVSRLITVGFDLPSSYLAQELSKEFEEVYFTAGFHPTELSKYREGDLDEIADLCRDPKCVALGEIGLDYHYPDTNKGLQKEIFVRQLKLADGLSLPVQIHSRDCAEDMCEILFDNKNFLRSGALMHCYSHSAEIAARLATLGLYFSFGGSSTRKGAKRAQKAIAALPITRILTETDSPYMPPKSLEGVFPNTPLSIPEICRSIADIKGLTEEEAAERIFSNAHTLFKKLG